MYTVTQNSMPIIKKISYPNVDIYQYSDSPVYTVNALSQVSIVKIEEAPFTLFYPLPSYLDMNQNPEVRHKTVMYFYYKTLDKWLFKEDGMVDILNYLKIKGDKVDVLDKMADYKDSNIVKDTQGDVEKKIKFIENNIFSKNDMEKILYSYIQETGANWYDLEKHSFYIKQAIRGFLKKKLKKLVERN